MKKKHTIFLDTSTIIGGGIDFLERTSKVANLFITDIVLQELDGLKNAEGDTGYKAREIYRQLAPATTKELYELPDRTELKRDDTLFEMTLPSGLVFYTIHRNKYKTKDINDSKIIEVANDYKGTLATIDIAQSVRAKSVGCEVWVVKGGESKVHKNYSIIIFGLGIMMFATVFGYGWLSSSLKFSQRWNAGSGVATGFFKARPDNLISLIASEWYIVLVSSGFFLAGLTILIVGFFPEKFPKHAFSNKVLEDMHESPSFSSSLNESSCVVTGTDFIGTSSSTYYK